MKLKIEKSEKMDTPKKEETNEKRRWLDIRRLRK